MTTTDLLGKTVVAEGVEDQATFELLQQIGCDAAQGFHICPPLPAERIRDWLAAQRR